MKMSKWKVLPGSVVTLSALCLATGCVQQEDEDIDSSDYLSAAVGTEITMNGTALVTIVDSLDENDTPHSETRYYLLRNPSDNAPAELDLQGASPSFGTGDEISVTGEVQVQGDVRSVAVESVQQNSLQTIQASVTEREPKVRKILVMLVGNTKATVPQMQAMFNADSPGSFAAFIAENSGSIDTFTADVVSFPSIDTSICDSQATTMMNPAKEAFEQTGGKISDYDHVAYIIGGNKCPWYAMGSVVRIGGLAEKWSLYSDNATRCNTFAHEIGHNLGMFHSYTRACGSNIYNASSANCTDTEYGNPFDVMGVDRGACSASGHYSAAFKRSEGYLRGCGNVTAAGSATFALSPTEGQCGTRSVRIPIAGESNYYYIEYRKAGLTQFSGAAGKDRVLLSVAEDPSDRYSGYSYLLDAAPATKTFDDAQLVVGQTYRLPGNVTIQLLSMEGVATVKVTTPGTGASTCDDGTTPPTIEGRVGAVCN